MLKLRFLSPILITTALIACSSDDPGGPDGTGGEGGGSETGGSGNDGTGGSEGGAGNLPNDVEETIGEDGGTLETESASLDIPAGALPEGVAITVAGLPEAEVADLPQTTEDIVLAAVPVAFLPHGLTFDEPVAVALAYDPDDAGDVQLVVMKLDSEDDTTWEIVPGAVFEDGKATFSITSFSVYGVFKDPKGVAEDFYSGSDGTGGSGNGSGGSDGTGGETGNGGGSGGDEGSGGKDGSGGDEGSGGAGQGGTGQGGSGGASQGGSGGAGQGGGPGGGPSGDGGGPAGDGGAPGGDGGAPGAGGASQGGTTGAGGAGQGGGPGGGPPGDGGGPTGDGGAPGGDGGAPGAGGASQGGTTGAGGAGQGGGPGGGPPGDGGGPPGDGGATSGDGGAPGDGGASQGGTTGAGGSGEGGGGAGGGPGGGPNPGYLDVPSWHGYGWTFASAGSEIQSDVSYAPAPNCAWGFTGPDYSEFAVLGYNVSETLAGGDNVPTLVTGEGVFVEVDNFEGRELRVQVSANGGQTNWCAPLGVGGFIPWSEFNTTCWDPASGTPFNAAADLVESVGIVAFGQLEELPFDHCVRELRAGNAPQLGFYDHGGFRGDGYVEISGSTMILDESVSTSYELPVSVFGDFGPVDGSDVTVWFNLNQDEPGGPEGTVVPSYDGVQVRVQNGHGSWMQVVITNGDITWCAPHYGGWDEFVPWTEFNTSCADGLGAAYDFEPISSLGVKFWPSPQAVMEGEFALDVGVEEIVMRPFQDEGFLMQGEWFGYGTMSFSGGATGWSNLTHTSNSSYCSGGQLPADPAGKAEMLFALNQHPNGNFDPPVTTTGDGVEINLDNGGNTPLEVILVAESGDRYCYPVMGYEPFVPWEDFNTECDGSGTMLLPEVTLTHAGIVASSGAAPSSEYNFCFNGLGSRSAPLYGYYNGYPFKGEGDVSSSQDTVISSENVSTSEYGPYCMYGTVGGGMGDFARLRFATNQEPGGPEGTSLPLGDGLLLDYMLQEGELARVVLTSEGKEFCMGLGEPFDPVIPWSLFVNCDGSGEPYAGEAFSAISIEVVPGGSSDFATCLFNLSTYEEGGGGTGGSGGAGGGPGGGLPPPVGRTDFHPGMLDDGTWSGTGYSFATDLSFVDTDVLEWDGPLACASGFVGEPFTEFASVGYAVANGASVSVVGEGIWIDLRSSYFRDHRVNVANNATGDYWCASLGAGSTGGPVFIPWDALNTTCWEPGGQNFDPLTQQISHVEIQVPSTGMDEDFEFCIDRMQAGMSTDF